MLTMEKSCFLVILQISAPLLLLLSSLCLSQGDEPTSPENEAILQIMKEELDQFRIDMTKAFMEAHSRRKRAASGMVMDLSISSQHTGVMGPAEGPLSVFTLGGIPYLVKQDGIYKLANVMQMAESPEDFVTANSDPIRVAKLDFEKNEVVLDTIEWQRNLFLLTTNGRFSTIRTMNEDDRTLVFRQKIRNEANAAHGKFFVYQRNLYMIIANDNKAHSTTFSPVFRWTETYMDQIHKIQTTGASATETFEINGIQYLAIAQSEDTNGNPLLGTIVLSMDNEERLQLIQLLWSSGANSLHYMHTDKEHFLVVGQQEEPAIAYWFGGEDFINWQQFDDLKGSSLLLNGMQMTRDDPVLIASDGGDVKVFTRSASESKKLTTWVQNKNFKSGTTSTNSRSQETLKMKFIQVDAGGAEKQGFLVLTKKLGERSMRNVEFYPIKLEQIPLTISRTKGTGDKLSQCLNGLGKSLDEAEPALQRINVGVENVLTTDRDVNFMGTLVSQKIVKMDPQNSKVTKAQVTPNVRAGSAAITSPSDLLSRIEDRNLEVEEMKSKLDKVLYKRQRTPEIVTGNLVFTGPLRVSNLEGSETTSLQPETINNIKWEDLDKNTLKLKSDKIQEVTAAWTLESLEVDKVSISDVNSKLDPNNFMLKSCPQEQILTGHHEFMKELIFSQIKVEPTTTINGIKFSDFAMKKNKNQEIKGYKHVDFVEGDYKVERVNDEHLASWFASVAMINSADKQIFTGPVTFSDNAALRVEKLLPDMVNDRNWKDFQKNVLLNGEDQQVEGFMEFDAMRVDNLNAHTILGVKSESLLNTDTVQNVKSHLNFEKIEIDGPLSTRTINDVSLKDAVNRNEKEVVINGPVLLEEFHVEDIHVAEDMTMANLDISKLPDLKKIHSYTTADNSPIILKDVKAKSLSAQFINGHKIDDIPDMYWSKLGNNVVTSPQLLLDERDVNILSDRFVTHRLNGFAFPDEYVFLGEDTEEKIIKAPLSFIAPVKILGDVTMDEGAKIRDIDMSKAQSSMVDSNFKGKIRGHKTFEQVVVAEHGASFKTLNEKDPVKDVVLLNEVNAQTINGIVTFKEQLLTERFIIRNGNMDVGGQVNDLRLDEVGATTAYVNRENFIDGDIIFEKSVNAEKFSVERLNEMNVKQIMNNMIFLNSPDMQTIQGEIISELGNVQFKEDAMTRTLNGLSVMNYLTQVVRLDEPPGEFIHGVKTFHNAIFADQLTCSTFGGVDLADLEANAFSKTKSQSVSGKWSMMEAEFQDLKTEKLGDVSVDNIVFTDEPFEVNSPVSFTSRDGSNVLGPMNVAGNVNGIKFDDNLENLLTIDGIGNLDHVTINGDMSWQNSRPDIRRLSYLFDNAVDSSKPQRISGKVNFAKGFHSTELSTPNTWLDNVNLDEIQSDAVMKNEPNLVLFGSNTFEKPLRIENLVGPVDNLEVTDINGVNLVNINDDIVKMNDPSDSGRLVEGRKVLDGMMQVENLMVQDKISDLSVDELVIKNDPREINRVTLKDISVEKDIQWENAEGIDLRSLLQDRVSLTKPEQNLQGEFTFQSLKVEEQCQMAMINNIKPENVLRKDMKELPTISGQKILKGKLTLDGEMEAASLNDHSLEELMTSTLRLDRKEVINRPVVFQKSVKVNKDVNIESVNDINLKTFSKQVSERVAKLVDNARSSEVVENQLQEQMSMLRKMTQDGAAWFKYMRVKRDWSDLGSKSKVGSVLKGQRSGEILVSFMETSVKSVDNTESGVEECGCNEVDTVLLKESELSVNDLKMQKLVGKDSCLQVFHVQSPNGNLYTVLSDAVSSDISCNAKTEDTTKIMTDKRHLGELQLGHVSDVGVFSDKGSDFLVIAQYFDKVSRTHSTTTKIVEISADQIPNQIQDLETHGAKKVALNKVNGRWMLAIANSRNAMDETSCNAESAIYEWSPEAKRFLLLKNVMTDGVFDAVFLNTPTHKEFYQQNFVAFAQEGNSALGEVLIMKYDQLEGNFVMSQTIRSKWPVTSLRSTCFCTQCFIMTAVPQEGITFYENKFVEGFQPYYKAPILGAMDILHFTAQDKHLFAIATNKGPILAEAQVAGECPVN